MSHHEDALNELTAEAHHAHATSLHREVIQLRKEITDLKLAQKATNKENGVLVDAGICHAFEVHDRDVRIKALEAVNAAQRKENVKLTHEVSRLNTLAEQRRLDLRASRQSMRRLRGKR